MSSYLRFANLPPELTDEDILAGLDQAVLKDRTAEKIVREPGQVILWIGVPWERHIADAVARKLNGVFWKGRSLHVSATALFGD